MGKSSWVRCGYLMADKNKQTVKIMVVEGGLKKYYVANLGDALEVMVGRRRFAAMLKKRK